MASNRSEEPVPESAVEEERLPQESGGRDMFDRRPLKISESIALEIVRDVVGQSLEPGDRLPREADMLEHYGVSRSSLREALRLLEVQGLIRIRPGPGGGPVVGHIHHRNLAKTLRLYMHLMGTTYEDLMSSWVQMEPILARLAADNPDRARVEESMRRYLVPLKPDGSKDMRAEGDLFHAAVAQLSGNRLLALTFRAVTSAMEDHIVEAVRQDNFDDEIGCDHRDIAQAILDGDGARAHELMKLHVEHIAAHFRAFFPRAIGEKVPLR